VHVYVGQGLARGLPIIDSDVEAIGMKLGLERLTYMRYEAPDILQHVGWEVGDPGPVNLRDDECVTATHGIPVSDRGCVFRV